MSITQTLKGTFDAVQISLVLLDDHMVHVDTLSVPAEMRAFQIRMNADPLLKLGKHFPRRKIGVLKDKFVGLQGTRIFKLN